MAERDQPQNVSHGVDKKPQREGEGKIGQAHGARQQDRDYGIKPGGTVGRDVPDESKEHHTEIAVEAGRQHGEQREKKP